MAQKKSDAKKTKEGIKIDLEKREKANLSSSKDKTPSVREKKVSKRVVTESKKAKTKKNDHSSSKSSSKGNVKTKKETQPLKRKTISTLKKEKEKDMLGEVKDNSTKVNKNSLKVKAKEKAVKNSQKAYVQKKEQKSKKKDLAKNDSVKSKKKSQKSSKEKKKAIYVSPSQLEKQHKRNFPWEVIVILLLVVCLCIGGFKFYEEMKNKDGNASRSNSYDILNAISLDQNNLISVGGSNFKYSKMNSYIKDTTKAKLLKMSTSGDVIFEKVYNSKKSSVFNSVVTVSDGYIVVGSMSGDAENGKGKQLGLFVKYDKDGNIVWEKTYQSSGNVQFLKVQLVENGYLVVGLSSVSTDKEEVTDGGALLFQYDLDGNVVWQKFYGNPTKARFNSLVVANHGIYVVGKNENDFGILARYSMDGNFEWDKVYSYTDELGLVDIVAKDQSLYVVGSKKILPNSDDNSERNTSNTDALLLKYSWSGDIEFEKFFGGSNEERYTALTVYGRQLYVVGSSNSTDSGLKVFTDGKQKTGILIKYDIDGDIERKTTFGGSNNDVMTAIITDNSNLYMTCFTNSKDGNILTGLDNGKDSFGKLIKANSRLRTLFVK